jgi:cytochrome c-type biogenesis protein CcmH/NrfG
LPAFSAFDSFEKAMQLNPNRLMHYIALGEVYVEWAKKRRVAA